MSARYRRGRPADASTVAGYEIAFPQPCRRAAVHLARLREEIAEGHALAIVGAGVSIGATHNAKAASWTGLLEDGVDRCQSLGQPADWADRVRAEIHSGDMDDLLSAAEKISRKLGAPKGGEFHRWLRETVGALEAEDRTVLEALRDLGICRSRRRTTTICWKTSPACHQLPGETATASRDS